jgi:hypothetical protein
MVTSAFRARTVMCWDPYMWMKADMHALGSLGIQLVKCNSADELSVNNIVIRMVNQLGGPNQSIISVCKHIYWFLHVGSHL